MKATIDATGSFDAMPNDKIKTLLASCPPMLRKALAYRLSEEHFIRAIRDKMTLLSSYATYELVQQIIVDN